MFIYLSYIYISIPYIFTWAVQKDILYHTESDIATSNEIYSSISTKLTKKNIYFKSANLLSTMCKMCKN